MFRRSQTAKEVSLSMEIYLNEDSPLVDMARSIPSACPACGYQHDSMAFKSIDDKFACCSCGYQLTDADMFPSVIE